MIIALAEGSSRLGPAPKVHAVESGDEVLADGDRRLVLRAPQDGVHTTTLSTGKRHTARVQGLPGGVRLTEWTLAAQVWSPGADQYSTVKTEHAPVPAAVTVNGTGVTVNQSDRGRVDLGQLLRPGRNQITVTVATAMFNAVRATGDTNYQTPPWQRTGLLGPVVLTPYREITVWRR